MVIIIIVVLQSSQSDAQKENLSPPTPLHAYTFLGRQLRGRRLAPSCEGLLDAPDAGHGTGNRGCLRSVVGGVRGFRMVARHCGVGVFQGLELWKG